MRHVPFDPEKLNDEEKSWWSKWSARALARRDIAIQQYRDGKAIEFDGSVWADLKAWLLENVFARKCAYCEVGVSPGDHGAAEHFRPKGNVTISTNGKRQRATINGENHPGYFWLAYDWRNLLPSCDKCNNAKSDQFPVEASHAAKSLDDPTILDVIEKPLLINPYFEDPDKYLVFGQFGVVVARDGNRKGRETIEVLGLNREPLKEARWRQQTQVVKALGTSVADLWLGREGFENDLKDYVGPSAPFSAAVKASIRERAAAVADRMRGI